MAATDTYWLHQLIWWPFVCLINNLKHSGLHPMIISIITFAKEVVFRPCSSVFRLACQVDFQQTWMEDRPRTNPVNFWCRSRNFFLLSLTLQKGLFSTLSFICQGLMHESLWKIIWCILIGFYEYNLTQTKGIVGALV